MLLFCVVLRVGVFTMDGWMGDDVLYGDRLGG